MVISLDEESKNAVLSLRQTEILAKLQPLTSEIDAHTDSSYVRLLHTLLTVSYFSQESLSLHFIRNMADTCSSPLPALPIVALFAISFRLSPTCDSGEILSYEEFIRARPNDLPDETSHANI